MNASLKTAGICIAIGVVLSVAPSWLTETLRSAVHDGLHPGHASLVFVRDSADTWQQGLGFADPSDSKLATLESELDEWKLRYRRLQAEMLVQQTELQQLKKSAANPWVAAEKFDPLVVSRLAECRVLGHDLAKTWKQGKLLNHGSDRGLAESDIVLRSDDTLIDQSEDIQLTSGDPVYAGRTIVGEIAQVGRWTSTIRPITDSKYVALVQIVHRESGGLVESANGFLEGTGEELCRIKEVNSSETVHVGDAVFSAKQDSLTPQPMFYGTIERAELSENSLTWDIWIRPATQTEDLSTVTVLRRELNPLRMSAQ